ncbi:HEPN domain-containing protein [Novosphingobium sp.]|uniref:HEPN domain-containing protein n=1 Tax=Novosphingobium sp. TaxID=1874826 RepID=UPI0028A5AB9C|nr:HEPN domain-containing protein [Novosphingobium sp.]
MKSHVQSALRNFSNGCDRAQGLCSIHRYLKGAAPVAMDCDDILRSSVVLAVSSFDLFIHDLYRTEVVHRFISKKSSAGLKIPFDAGFLAGSLQTSAIDEQIRLENSYKSFVAPDKLSECLRPLIEKPWEKISTILGVPAPDSKARLKSIVGLRNRIAHEGDVNPALGGIDLWPIYSEDVQASVEFLRILGVAVAEVVDNA